MKKIVYLPLDERPCNNRLLKEMSSIINVHATMLFVNFSRRITTK